MIPSTFDSIIFINSKQPKMSLEIFRCSYFCLFYIFLVSNIPTLVNSTHPDQKIKTEEISEIGQNSGNSQIVTVEKPNVNQNVEERIENSSTGNQMKIADNNLEAGSSISETESWVDLVPIPIKNGHGRPIYDKDGYPKIDYDFKKSGKKIEKELQKEEEYQIGAEITDDILDDEIHLLVHSMIGHEDGAPALENLHPHQIHSQQSTDNGIGGSRRTPGPDEANLQTNTTVDLHPKEDQIQSPHSSDNGLGSGRKFRSHSVESIDFSIGSNNSMKFLNDLDADSPHSMQHSSSSKHLSPKQKLHRSNSFGNLPVEIEGKRPKILTRSRSDMNQREKIIPEESDSPLKKRQKISSSSSFNKPISDNEIQSESPTRKSLADFLKLSPSSKKSSPPYSFDQKKKVEIDDKKQPCCSHPFVKFGLKWVKKAINICRICVMGPGNYAKELEKKGKNGGLQKN